MDLEIVLREKPGEPGIVIGVFGRVLVHGDGQAQEEVGEAISLVGFGAGLGAGEAEGPVVIQQRLLDVLGQAGFPAEAHGMASLGVAGDVAEIINVRARNGTRDGLPEGKVTGHRDLRKARRSLREKVRAEIVQR